MIFLVEQSPLSTALCPSSNCHVVSHLKCLSQYFINQQDKPTTMVPRGGHCKSCKDYTLWGDVIRGCYRRMRSYFPEGHELSDNLEVQEKMPSLRRKKSASPRGRMSSKVKEKQGPYSSSTSMPGRPRKSLEVLSTPTILGLPSKGSRKRKQPASSVLTTEGKNLDLVTLSDIEDNATPMKRKRGRPRKDLAILDLVASSEIEDKAIPMKRKRGRPRKDLAILSPGASSVSSSRPLKASKKPKICASSAKLKLSLKGKGSRKKPKKGASPAKHKLSSKGKDNQSPAPYQPTKARIRRL